MFTQRRNQRGFYYANYAGDTEVISEVTGLPNGDVTRTFDEPVFAWGNISAVSGRMNAEAFGFNLDYDMTIAPATDAGEIREGARLWIKAVPPDSPHNYEVVRVSDSLNETVIAAKRVNARA